MSEPIVQPAGRGCWRVVVNGRSHLLYVAGPPHARWVFLDGQVACLDVDERGTATRAAGDDQLAAPMPATVRAIHVVVGQAVRAGDPLVTLEAMKMELSIVAPRDGEVATIACAAGALVQPGVALVTLR